ncbi:MAG: tRNA (adenosine(37)-N6)-dimethylallyltransferase MiaA [Candidatus Hydrogenedentes bacterium]|nr:tRNA (adenosine(37)-N6)-dimethylallyltransferase MiaA [Candidatus Hydrogenedentota bacterium]
MEGSGLRHHNAIVVLGPTASGKTRVGVHLAHGLGGEILSADSRQVYLGCDLGSGKDLHEYSYSGTAIPYHLIDLVTLETEYSVFDFQRDFFHAYEQILARAALPVIVGGTGLYLDAVLRGYRMVEAPINAALRNELVPYSDEALRTRLHQLRPNQHNTTDLVERERMVRAIEIAECERTRIPEPTPRLNAFLIGLQWPRAVLRKRIEARLKQRMRAGLADEVKHLHEAGVSWERLDRLGLEYRAVSQLLRGGHPSERAMIDRLTIDIGQFAKRQETWFRRMERQGHTIHWIQGDDAEAALALVRALE